MTYGLIVDIPAPVEVYDRVHAAMTARADGDGHGLLVHIGRPTPTGFQVIEVWESRETYERATAALVGPLVAELGEALPPPDRQAVEEFDVHGLVVPHGALMI